MSKSKSFLDYVPSVYLLTALMCAVFLVFGKEIKDITISKLALLSWMYLCLIANMCDKTNKKLDEISKQLNAENTDDT